MYATRTVRRPLMAAVVAAIAGPVAVAGCAGNGNGGETHPPELPGGSEAVVIQFETRGTSPPSPQFLQLRFSAVPEVTAYGDGRVVVASEGVGQIPQLRSATVSRSDLADLLAEADAAGLLGAVRSTPAVPHCLIPR